MELKSLKHIRRAITLLLIVGCISSSKAFSHTLTPKDGNQTIVEIASSDARFSILAEAVAKANLVFALSQRGPYTVFAPTNDAFEELFRNMKIDGIKDLTAEQLTTILLYHVLSGKVMSKDVRNGKVPTLNKDASLEISVYNTGIQLNKKTKVIIPDVVASNGVIHAIDRVLLP